MIFSPVKIKFRKPSAMTMTNERKGLLIAIVSPVGLTILTFALSPRIRPVTVISAIGIALACSVLLLALIGPLRKPREVRNLALLSVSNAFIFLLVTWLGVMGWLLPLIFAFIGAIAFLRFVLIPQTRRAQDAIRARNRQESEMGTRL
jgi:hypothetical protein